MILCFYTDCLSFWQVGASHLGGHLLCLPTCALGSIQENMTIRQLCLSLWRLENIWGISQNSTEKKLLQRLTSLKPTTHHWQYTRIQLARCDNEKMAGGMRRSGDKRPDKMGTDKPLHQ